MPGRPLTEGQSVLTQAWRLRAAFAKRGPGARWFVQHVIGDGPVGPILVKILCPSCPQGLGLSNGGFTGIKFSPC